MLPPKLEKQMGKYRSSQLIFANPAINVAAGLLYGNPSQVGTQSIAVLATIAYSALGTLIVYKISALITGGGRVTEREEDEGMDAAIHGEAADEFDN